MQPGLTVSLNAAPCRMILFACGCYFSKEQQARLLPHYSKPQNPETLYSYIPCSYSSTIISRFRRRNTSRIPSLTLTLTQRTKSQALYNHPRTVITQRITRAALVSRYTFNSSIGLRFSLFIGKKGFFVYTRTKPEQDHKDDHRGKE